MIPDAKIDREYEAHAKAKDQAYSNLMGLKKNWKWWAGDNEEWMSVGPCDTRDEAIEQATDECMGEFQDDKDGKWKLAFHIVEASNENLRLASWIEADRLLERAEDSLADSDRVAGENDDGPWFTTTPEQEKDLEARIKRVCDEWQLAHGLVFTCSTFNQTRNNEYVVVDHPQSDELTTPMQVDAVAA